MSSDNDLPLEPNDYMAAAYSELAHQARLRERELTALADKVIFEEDGPIAEMVIGAECEMKDTAGKLQRLADLYSERRELTTGYRR